ncbi:phosphonate metabolism transcriptional regulator PhnF [Mesorhizobium sp. M0938]|uniref:phosphonate metabolism transcriptional regulator PhnF n=1 Tax=unclassified Mesorhizobium TaxID=325217 RepID=UPI003336490D
MNQNTKIPTLHERSGNRLLAFDGLVFRPRSDTPIWQQIYDHIFNLIESGSLAPGSQLPGETHLAEKLAVTRITLRRALQQLQHEGHLTARKGVGIFVRNLPSTFTVRDGQRFLDNFEAHGQEIGTQTLLVLREPAGAAVAERLRLAPDTLVIRLCRIRTSDKQPVYVNTKVFPAHLFPDFEQRYDVRQSVTDVFRAHGIENYRRAETRISGGFASPDEAEILRLTPGTPVFRINAVNEDRNGVPIEWTRGTWPLTSVEFVF